MLNKVRIRAHEMGLLFTRGEYNRVLEPGSHWLAGLPGQHQVRPYDRREAWFRHTNLDLARQSGDLDKHADFLDLKEHQRALIWADGRFLGIAGPGLHGLWRGPREVRHEIFDVRQRRLTHADLDLILETPGTVGLLDHVQVQEGHAGVVLQAGQVPEVVPAGRHAFWRETGPYSLRSIDTRETIHDVTGQEILTADKVTLRLNTLVTARVTDPALAVLKTPDTGQVLHREVQMALREVIGTRELDQVLADKNQLADEMLGMVTGPLAAVGVTVSRVGIRDIILPGQMKEMMNQVMEARKSAEANLIRRREEVAAIRSQANTARIMEGNPTLLRLRELEVLQNIASNTRLKVMLGEKGLADKVTNLL